MKKSKKKEDLAENHYSNGDRVELQLENKLLKGFVVSGCCRKLISRVYPSVLVVWENHSYWHKTPNEQVIEILTFRK